MTPLPRSTSTIRIIECVRACEVGGAVEVAITNALRTLESFEAMFDGGYHLDAALLRQALEIIGAGR